MAPPPRHFTNGAAAAPGTGGSSAAGAPPAAGGGCFSALPAEPVSYEGDGDGFGDGFASSYFAPSRPGILGREAGGRQPATPTIKSAHLEAAHAERRLADAAAARARQQAHNNPLVDDEEDDLRTPGGMRDFGALLQRERPR